MAAQGGGPLSARWRTAPACPTAPLFAHAADMVGWSADAPARQEPPPPGPKPERDTAREIAFILQHAVPIAGTPAEAYLRGRGLDVPAGADLLFHPDLTHWETRAGLPRADRAGARRRRRRRRAAPDLPARRTARRSERRRVAKPRMMLGKTGGGAVRLGAARRRMACSGCAKASRPGSPSWRPAPACPSGRRCPPRAWSRCSCRPRRGASSSWPTTTHPAPACGPRRPRPRRLRPEGRQAAIALPPREGDDFNDMLLRDGAEAIAALVDAALRGAAAPPEPPSATQTGRHLPIGLRGARGPAAPLCAPTRAIWRAPWTAPGPCCSPPTDPPWLFRSGGLPTWVVPDDEGRPAAAAVTDERLRHMLAKLADWRRLNRKGDLVPAPPPTALVKSLLATPDPGLPVLAGIVTTPVFGRGGALLTEPGYHPDARLLYRPRAGLQRAARPGAARPPTRSPRRGRCCWTTCWATSPSSPRPSAPTPSPCCCSASCAPWSTARRRCT